MSQEMIGLAFLRGSDGDLVDMQSIWTTVQLLEPHHYKTYLVCI